jgi:hypothetical protein
VLAPFVVDEPLSEDSRRAVLEMNSSEERKQGKWRQESVVALAGRPSKSCRAAANAAGCAFAA